MTDRFVRLPRPVFALLCRHAEPPAFGLRYAHYGLGGITLEVTDPSRLQLTLWALQESLTAGDPRHAALHGRLAA